MMAVVHCMLAAFLVACVGPHHVACQTTGAHQNGDAASTSQKTTITTGSPSSTESSTTTAGLDSSSSSATTLLLPSTSSTSSTSSPTTTSTGDVTTPTSTSSNSFTTIETTSSPMDTMDPSVWNLSSTSSAMTTTSMLLSSSTLSTSTSALFSSSTSTAQPDNVDGVVWHAADAAAKARAKAKARQAKINGTAANVPQQTAGDVVEWIAEPYTTRETKQQGGSLEVVSGDGNDDGIGVWLVVSFAVLVLILVGVFLIVFNKFQKPANRETFYLGEFENAIVDSSSDGDDTSISSGTNTDCYTIV